MFTSLAFFVWRSEMIARRDWCVPRTLSVLIGGRKGQDFTELDAVEITWPENGGTPERARGGRVPLKPLNSLDQSFCALLDISKQCVVVGCEGSFFGDR
jgi:hypothetical protein